MDHLSVAQPLHCLAVTCWAGPAAFDFQTDPSSKNSFFQMGTSAFSSSMSQWQAWHTACSAPAALYVSCACALACVRYLKSILSVGRGYSNDHAGLPHVHPSHAVSYGHSLQLPPARGCFAYCLHQQKSLLMRSKIHRQGAQAS